MTEHTRKPRITEAMKDAMRAKDKPRLSAIRLIMAEFKRIEVDERIDIDDERVLVVLDKMSKQRRDSISQFEAADRQDLVDVEKAEIEIIKEFMPEALSDEEVQSIIAKAIADSGAESMKDMGKVMGIIKPQIQGRADMGEVSKAIKAKLN
jgi:uncharacterized protein